MTEARTHNEPLWKKLSGPWLGWAFRVTLGAVFIIASLDKVINPQAFAWNIANYHLVPHWGINLMAICLPWIELCCGAALVLGIGCRGNLLVIQGLLLIFIFAIISALRRGLDISCGCFSTDSTASSMTMWTLYWDLIWFGMGIHALIFDRGYLSIVRIWNRPPPNPVQGETT